MQEAARLPSEAQAHVAGVDVTSLLAPRPARPGPCPGRRGSYFRGACLAWTETSGKFWKEGKQAVLLGKREVCLDWPFLKETRPDILS